MRAGLLDREVVVQNYTESQDAMGQPVKTWSTLATVRAHVNETRGKERFQSNRDLGVIMATFTIRYLSGVTQRSRIQYNGYNYDVISIAERGRRQWLELVGEVLET